MSRCPASSSAARMTPTWPSIIPLGPEQVGARVGLRHGHLRVDGERGVVVDRPSSSSTPQWPWSVNSSRQVSAMTTVASPTSARTSRSATLSTPSGSTPAAAGGVAAGGHAEEHEPADPGGRRRRRRPCAASRGCAGRRRASTRSGVGSAAPSFTNIGSTSWRGRSVVSATSRRSAGVARSRRGRWVGKAMPSVRGVASVPVGDAPCPCRVAAARGGRAREPRRAADRQRRRIFAFRGRRQGTLGAQPRRVLGQRVDQRRHPRLLRLHVDPQPELARGLGRLRAEAGDDRPGVRLAGDADQVAHGRRRGEAHRVEPAGLDRLADRGGRRRGAHRAVGGDVVDLPAALAQPLGQRLGGDVRPRQQHPVDRVEHVVVVAGTIAEQALGRRLLLRRRDRAPG